MVRVVWYLKTYFLDFSPRAYALWRVGHSWRHSAARRTQSSRPPSSHDLPSRASYRPPRERGPCSCGHSPPPPRIHVCMASLGDIVLKVAPPAAAAAAGAPAAGAPASSSRNSSGKNRFSVLQAMTKLGKVRSKAEVEEVAEVKATGWSPYKQKIRSVGKLAIAFRYDLPDSSHIFQSFLPRMLHQQLVDYSKMSQGRLQFEAKGRSVEAAVMFSDASGFTQVHTVPPSARVGHPLLSTGHVSFSRPTPSLNSTALSDRPVRVWAVCATAADREARAATQRRRGHVRHHEPLPHRDDHHHRPARRRRG